MRPGLLVALLTVALLAAPIGAAASADSSFDDPTTTYTFDLQEDGDANVTVSVAYTLDSANETAAFREVGDGFERGAVGPRIAVFERAAAAAGEATGREMNVSDPRRNVTVRNDSEGPPVGVLELNFQWTNFATVEDDRLRVGDAYRTPNGTWLPGLREDQRLRVVAPGGYGIEDAAAARIEGGALLWEGPTAFDADDLRVVRSGGSTTSPNTTPPHGSSDDEHGGGLLQQLFSPVGGGMLVAVAVAAAGLYVVVRRDENGMLTGAPVVDGGASTDAPASGGDRGQEPTPDSGPEAAADPEPDADAETDADPETDADDPFAGVDEDLLSDEERVERLLEHNGGRMRQANIVTETGWSNAKVSQLLSAMDESDRVDKLRIGRENLISLPDVDNGTGNNGGS